MGPLAVVLGRAWEALRVESGKIDVEQESEEGLAPTVIHLLVDGLEVSAVAHVGGANFDAAEPPVILVDRHRPVTVAREDDVKATLGGHRVDALALDEPAAFGDQDLQDLFVLGVAGKEAFVGEQQDTLAHVRVEPAGDVLSLRDRDEAAT